MTTSDQEQADATAEKLGAELDRRPAATATVTAIPSRPLLVEDAGQTTIEVTPQLLKVRRPLTGTLATAIHRCRDYPTVGH
jgi:hypothetical protein